MHIEIELPNSAFSALRLNPAEFAQEMRLAADINCYEAGSVSQAEAAALAWVPREEFRLGEGRFKISAVQATATELEQELSPN